MRMTTARKIRGVQNDWRFVCQQSVAAIFAGIRSGLRLRFADRPQCSSLRTACNITVFSTGCSSTLLDYAACIAALFCSKSRIIQSLGPEINVLVDFLRQSLPASPANCTAPIQGNRSCWQKTANGRAGGAELFPEWKQFERRDWGGESGEVRG